MWFTLFFLYSCIFRLGLPLYTSRLYFLFEIGVFFFFFFNIWKTKNDLKCLYASWNVVNRANLNNVIHVIVLDGRSSSGKKKTVTFRRVRCQISELLTLYKMYAGSLMSAFYAFHRFVMKQKQITVSCVQREQCR